MYFSTEEMSLYTARDHRMPLALNVRDQNQLINGALCSEGRIHQT